MDTELDKIHEAESLKMDYQRTLKELKEKYRGNPGQQEALAYFGNEDPADGLAILDLLDTAGLTPWDVGEIYGAMNETQSLKNPGQQSLEVKIFGMSRYSKRGDLKKITDYLVGEKNKPKQEAAPIPKKREISQEEIANGENFFTTFIMGDDKFTPEEKVIIRNKVSSQLGGWSVKDFATEVTRNGNQIIIKTKSGQAFLYL